MGWSDSTAVKEPILHAFYPDLIPNMGREGEVSGGEGREGGKKERWLANTFTQNYKPLDSRHFACVHITQEI